MFAFTLSLLCIAIDAAGEFLGVTYAQHDMFDILKLAFPILLLFTHASTMLKFRRALILITLAMSIGLIAEIVGVHYGSVFGEKYDYNYTSPIIFSSTPMFHSVLSLKNVPLLIPCFWAVFIYAGYSLTSSFLAWLKINKPSRARNERGRLLLLVICDATLVLLLDLLMDPILVRIGNWTWQKGSPYYGIPLGNFVGWFLVAFMVCGLFRLFEYHTDPLPHPHSIQLHLMPAGGFLAFWAISVVAAIQYQMHALIAVGICTLLPIILFNVYCCIQHLNDAHLCLDPLPASPIYSQQS